jgi:hypothetical protein
MHVDDRRPFAAKPGVLERRTAEHRKPPGVIGVILAPLVIDAGAVEQLRRVHENGRNAGLQFAPEERHGDAPLAHGKRRALAGGIACVGSAVPRHDQGDTVPEPGQCVWQRARHLGQAACLGKWMRLGADHQDRKRLSVRVGPPCRG